MVQGTAPAKAARENTIQTDQGHALGVLLSISKTYIMVINASDKL